MEVMGWLQLIALVRCAMEDGGLVVVSCCDGLGPIVYILMCILRLPIKTLILIEKESTYRDMSDLVLAPMPCK